ncbi:MAG: AGE family epimerase/isomerase [Alphaproteobacteria bacterium]
MPGLPAAPVARLQAWLVDSALPLWATAGVDPRGGFVEALALDGTPMPELPRRLRVQARQLYVYSHAAVLGWPGAGDGPDPLATARQGFAFLTRHYWHPEGGFRFAVARDGRPTDDRRELYEQAFALLALAWYGRASGDPTAAAWIDRTLAFIDGALADPTHGGFREGAPPPADGVRRQNPHMHLFEAMLALHATTGEARFLDRARVLFALLRDRFVDRRSGALREHFASDWTPRPGDTLEPGHHFEWTWLLDRYEAASGEPTATLRDGLCAFAHRHGIDDDGLAFDGVAADGALKAGTKRLWVQTEAIKAELTRHEAGAPDAAARIERLIDGLFARYLAAPGVAPGAWQDHIRRDGVGFATSAPASSLYHLFVMASEVARVAGEPLPPR